MMKLFAIGAVAAALGALLLDRSRRKQLVRRAGDVGRKAMHLRERQKEQPNDATLVAKVESEVFRDPAMPKGAVNVNAENGVVVLRGQVEKPELIAELEKKVRKVQGVHDVENLLHLPGAEAPMHQSR